MDKQPLISVIVPVYNVDQYLRRCLDSIINQTYKHLEIILINDGSTDNSGDICEEYLSRDNRIAVINQENMGLSMARNNGLTIARGDFIAFVDSDDWLKAEMLGTMLKFALQNNIQLVECNLIHSHNLDNVKKVEPRNSFIESRAEAMLRLLTETNYSVWRRLYAKDLIKDLRFIPGKISEDVFFTIDVINKIDKQGYISDQLYIYNTENFSITRSPYDLKKIESKDAIQYPAEQTKHYGKPVRVRANYLLLRGLISHYKRILLHSHLDEDSRYSKQFKKEVAEQLKLLRSMGTPWTLLMINALVIKFLPISIYRFFLKINEARIGLIHRL